MKNLLTVLSFFFFSLNYSNGQGSISEKQTEEYAIINVFQKGKKNYYSVTIGSKSDNDKEFEKETNDKRFDMAPIIGEMEKLNILDYQLFSSSTAMIPFASSTSGIPYYTFVFVKRKLPLK